jgi:hypothetical protein
MKPAAIAFDTPNQRRPIDFTNTNGSAPSPVARAVRKAAKVTVTTLLVTGSGKRGWTIRIGADGGSVCSGDHEGDERRIGCTS